MRFILLFLFPILAFANPIDDNCPQFVTKFGAPIYQSGIAECHIAYATVVSKETKDPVFVVEHLTSEGLVCSVKRANDFHTDTSLPLEYRSTPADYSGSGYDRGHLSPAQDQCATKEEESDSFCMCNMVPQDPNNNRGIWKHLEEYSRKLAQRYDIYVISGPIFTGGVRVTIGNGVAVPDKLFKVIYNNSLGSVEAYILPNSLIPVKDLYKYRVSVLKVEEETGLILFPKDVR